MNPFDCLCGHAAHTHTVTVWPQVAKLCRTCACAGYAPLYKNQAHTATCTTTTEETTGGNLQ